MKCIAEADVHTAIPSLGNAAATWAGWAVTAVAAKFYRSQSDTGRQRPSLTGKALSKPASLGMLKDSESSSISVLFEVLQFSSKKKIRNKIVMSHPVSLHLFVANSN